LLSRWGAGHSFFILQGLHLDFAKNILPPLEPKLLVMWERIGEVLKVVYGAYQFAETWYKCQKEWRYMAFGASQYFPCLILYYQLALKGSSAIP
jgi:hypothetical protein